MFKMKNKLYLMAAVVLGFLPLLSSCTNDMLDSDAGTAMLEAEVSGVAPTRAAVEGTTLPAGSNYGLYVFNINYSVLHKKKMDASSTATGYELAPSSQVLVGAYYPYSETTDLTKDYMTIYPGSTDYLHTVGSPYYTKSNPKASLTMHHALARVKFNVSVASDAKSTYAVELSSLSNVSMRGTMSLLTNIVSSGSRDAVSITNGIKSTLKGGESSHTEIFLLPQNIKTYHPIVNLFIDKEYKDISSDIVNTTASGLWESGKVYTYNITISEGTKVTVSSCTIEEWGKAEELEGATANEFVKEEEKTFEVGGVSFKMKLVKAGTFQMGSTVEDLNANPVHQVTITKDYYMGETEVTQALWKAVTGYSPTVDGSGWDSSFGIGDNLAAYYISYDDVKSFITKLNNLTGQTFRMPTEAEWEFAAKGGINSKGFTYSGSNTIGDVAWYKSNGALTAHEVKTKAANELGLYDMSGNVYEWCADWFGSYSSSALTDPIGPASGSFRVIRGGSWFTSDLFCRSVDRAYVSPLARNFHYGFRLCLSSK